MGSVDIHDFTPLGEGFASPAASTTFTCSEVPEFSVCGGLGLSWSEQNWSWSPRRVGLKAWLGAPRSSCHVHQHAVDDQGLLHG